MEETIFQFVVVNSHFFSHFSYLIFIGVSAMVHHIHHKEFVWIPLVCKRNYLVNQIADLLYQIRRYSLLQQSKRYFVSHNDLHFIDKDKLITAVFTSKNLPHCVLRCARSSDIRPVMQIHSTLRFHIPWLIDLPYQICCTLVSCRVFKQKDEGVKVNRCKCSMCQLSKHKFIFTAAELSFSMPGCLQRNTPNSTVPRLNSTTVCVISCGQSTQTRTSLYWITDA